MLDLTKSHFMWLSWQKTAQASLIFWQLFLYGFSSNVTIFIGFAIYVQSAQVYYFHPSVYSSVFKLGDESFLQSNFTLSEYRYPQTKEVRGIVNSIPILPTSA